VLSRLSAPHVTVASAVLATVAMPFLIPAQQVRCSLSIPRPLGCPLTLCSLLAGLPLTQRPADRNSPPQLLCKGADGALRLWAAQPPNVAMGSGGDGGVGGVGGGGGGSGSAGGGAPPSTDDESGEWRDGSIVHDTPREQLAQHFGASFVVASQCNPHVVPLMIELHATAIRTEGLCQSRAAPLLSPALESRPPGVRLLGVRQSLASSAAAPIGVAASPCRRCWCCCSATPRSG
jgi:hypothetical protein